WWAPLLLAPLALVALIAPLGRRWATGWVLLGIIVAGLATALLAVGVAVSAAQSQEVALWPGTGLSLAWLGLTGAVVVTLDSGATGALRDRVPTRWVRTGRPWVIAVLLVLASVTAAPGLASLHTGRALLTDGPRTTLPAYV